MRPEGTSFRPKLGNSEIGFFRPRRRAFSLRCEFARSRGEIVRNCVRFRLRFRTPGAVRFRMALSLEREGPIPDNLPARGLGRRRRPYIQPLQAFAVESINRPRGPRKPREHAFQALSWSSSQPGRTGRGGGSESANVPRLCRGGLGGAALIASH